MHTLRKKPVRLFIDLMCPLLHLCVDAEDELAKAKVEKADVEKQLATLEALKSKLETQTTDINYITGRLDQFANIWSLVSRTDRQTFNCAIIANVVIIGGKRREGMQYSAEKCIRG